MGGKLLSRKLRSVPAGQKEVNSSVGPIVTGESSTPQKLPSADELPACPSHLPYSTSYLVQTYLGKRLYETEAIAEEPGVDVEETNKDFLLEGVVIITSRVSKSTYFLQ